jgi:AraC family transcriptional regulator, transcriptional activator of pobA
MSNNYKNNHHDSLLLKLEDILAIFPSSLTGKSRSYFRMFHINRIEDFINFVPNKQPPYRKPVMDFMFITNGNTVRTKGLDTFDISPGMFFFIPAYQIRTAVSMSTDVTGFFCHFDMEIFNKNFVQNDVINQFPFLQYIGNPVVSVPDESMPFILHLLERLEYAYQNEHQGDINLFSVYLLALFFELSRFTELEHQPKNSAALLTQRYKNALMEHIYDIQTVADYAGHLSVSQNYLNRCLHATIGKSAHDLLNDMLLLEAKSLLKQSGLSISEIAYKIGKKDHSDFSRFFKAHTGLTPKEFRK